MKTILNLLHIHFHSTPIVSKYVSFHTRHIIFECSCGHRCTKEMTLPYGRGFPIYTGSLSDREFNEVLHGNESDTTKEIIAIDESVNQKVFG